MKKTIVFILMICLVLGFSACEHKLVNTKTETNEKGIKSNSEYTFFETVADWPYYETAEELTDTATDVYIGKVKEISFVIIDRETNEPADINSVQGGESSALYTVYTVEITDSFKGEKKDEVKIKVNGGLPGYKEDEQYKLQESLGSSIIPVWDKNLEQLEIGSEYVFCTIHKYGSFEIIPSLYQFAFQIDSANAKAVLACIK